MSKQTSGSNVKPDADMDSNETSNAKSNQPNAIKNQHEVEVSSNSSYQSTNPNKQTFSTPSKVSPFNASGNQVSTSQKKEMSLGQKISLQGFE